VPNMSRKRPLSIGVLGMGALLASG
jgi:hypothetical protein